MGLRGKNVVVTGGAGFIGSHLVEGLLDEGCRVKVIDNLFTGKKEFLGKVLGKIGFVEGSITDSALLEKELEGIDYVFHEAALRSVRKSVGAPLDYNEVNIGGTVNLLEAARKNSVKRVIFASSSSVYGDSGVFPQKESFNPNPRSPYAITKLVGEHYLRIYGELYGLDTVSLRYFNVFGPRQDPKGEYAAVIPLFIEKLLENKLPIIFGDGKQSRDFTFVKDIVRANIAAANAPSRVSGRAFNVARGDSVSLLVLVRELNSLLGTNAVPVHVEPKIGDVRKTMSDSSLAKKELGFECIYSFGQGLEQTIDYLKASQ